MSSLTLGLRTRLTRSSHYAARGVSILRLNPNVLYRVCGYHASSRSERLARDVGHGVPSRHGAVRGARTLPCARLSRRACAGILTLIARAHRARPERATNHSSTEP